jgi:hypothetical protein
MSQISQVSEEVLSYFKRHTKFPSLAEWSFTLESICKEYSLLRGLIVESIDLKDSPTMKFRAVESRLHACLGITIDEKEGKSSFDKKHLNLHGLPPTVVYLIKKAMREENIKEDSIDDGALDEITQTFYMNEVFKHRHMGFTSEVLIYDAYRLWDWCSQIANLCNSFLPVYDKLIKNEVFLFPGLDKDLQEASAAANRLMLFLQSQQQMPQVQQLTMPENKDDPDPFLNKIIKEANVSNPKGGVLISTGDHIMLGDPVFQVKEEDAIMTLDLPRPYSDQPSWTVAKVYVRPGQKLGPKDKMFALAALNIRAEQSKFMKFFQDVYRQVGRIRKKAVYIKEVIEEQMREGRPSEEEETTGFKPKQERFVKLEEEPSSEAVKAASDELGVPLKESDALMKKISRTRKKLGKSQ